jgi:hypothetical protein
MVVVIKKNGVGDIRGGHGLASDFILRRKTAAGDDVDYVATSEKGIIIAGLGQPVPALHRFATR